MLPLELDSLSLVEGLSSVLYLFLCVLACLIYASKYLLTLLVLGISYLLGGFFYFLGLGWLCKGVVSPDGKLTDISFVKW